MILYYEDRDICAVQGVFYKTNPGQDAPPDATPKDHLIGAVPEATNLRPNPARDRVSLLYTFEEGKGGELKILNTVGQIVLEETIDGNGSEMQIDISSLATGIYFVKINSLSGFSKSIKLVVSN